MMCCWWCWRCPCAWHHYGVMLTLFIVVPSSWCYVELFHACSIIVMVCWGCSCVLHHCMVLCCIYSCLFRHYGVMLTLTMSVSAWRCDVELMHVCSVMTWCDVDVVQVCSIMTLCDIGVVNGCSGIMIWCWCGSWLFHRGGVMLEWFMVVP